MQMGIVGGTFDKPLADLVVFEAVGVGGGDRGGADPGDEVP